jgi:uncharacterized membrane protein
LAVLSLIFGISAWILICALGFPGIFAVIFGHMARSEVRRGTRSGDGLAVAGLILGYMASFLAFGYLFFSAVG